MPNNTTRMHLRTDIDASVVNVKPNEIWPGTLTHKGSTFTKNLCQYSPSRKIVWCEYHSNTRERFWVLRVWAV